jgi:class 3 adenylate cyclase
MAKFSNRTYICSVLYLEIAEYALRSSGEQIALKARLNAALSEAVAGVAVEDRVVVDAGSSAALGFLGDPEAALSAGVSVCDAFPEQEATTGARIRAGINVGPVGLVKDMNGKPVIVGDGINTAQTIMLLSGPGQILVSRSYRDVMVRISESYVDLLHYQGEKTDKNARAHWVYAVGAAASDALRSQRAKTGNARGSLGPGRGWAAAIAARARDLFR